MTAAKISLKEGHVRAIVFSIGACLIIFIQTYIAAIFARYLSNHQEIIDILQRVAFVIFVLITIYFLFSAKHESKKKSEPKIRSKYSRFFHGLFLSSINIFPIPYQAYLAITFASFKWLNFQHASIIAYVLGVVVGSFLTLYMYIFFFDKIKEKSLTTQKNMNRIIGCITGIISIVTLFSIIKKM